MDPAEIPRFITALENGADVVKGSRFIDGGRTKDMTLTRRIGNKMLLMLVNLLWSTSYTDLCYGFEAFKRDALQRLLPKLRAGHFDIEAEIFIKSKKYDLTVTEVPSIEYERTHGQSNLRTFRDGLNILKKIMIELLIEPTP